MKNIQDRKNDHLDYDELFGERTYISIENEIEINKKNGSNKINPINEKKISNIRFSIGMSYLPITFSTDFTTAFKTVSIISSVKS